MTNDKELEELAQCASEDRDKLAATTKVHRATPESRQAILALLERAAENRDDVEAVRRAGGRPALDPAGQTSVAWRVRVPASLDEAFKALAESEARSFSDVLRNAAQEYLAHHSA